MSESVPPPETLDSILASLDSHLATLKAEVVKLDPVKPVITTATTDLEQDTKALRGRITDVKTTEKDLETVAAHLGTIDRELSAVKKISAVQKAIQKLQGWGEVPWDVARLVVVWGLALWARQSPGESSGFWAVFIANAYMAFLLITAGIRSDRTYPIPDRVRAVLYMFMPTRLVAIFFVAGLFSANLWGYAALYEAVTTGVAPQMTSSPNQVTDTAPTVTPVYSRDKALELSFLTLATFDGPTDEPAEVRSLMLWELRSAILLVIGIFAMLINRISEF